MTLISNCTDIQTEFLNRTLPDPELDIDGILHVARNMESDDAFIVSMTDAAGSHRGCQLT